MYTTIIWDFNGTILDDTELCVQTENILRIDYQLPDITVEFFQKHLTFPVRDYYKNIGMNFTDAEYADAAERFMKIYQPASLQISLRAGVKDYIIGQKEKGRKQILLSASQRNNLLEQTDHYGITHLFDKILGLGDIFGNSKIALALNWFASAGIEPNQAVVIGDTVHDFEVAQALGCECILLTGGHNNRERLSATGAIVLDDVAALDVRLR
jgi:phosphoglycolate phosphatase